MSDSNEDVCPICRCSFEEDSSCVSTPCGHKYHFRCFMTAAQNSDNCSICRQSLYPENESGASSLPVVPVTSTLETNGEQVIEIDINDLREHVVSRLARSRRENNRIDDDDDDDDDDVILRFEEGSLLENSRLQFTLFQNCNQGRLPRVRELIGSHDDLKYAEDDERNTIVHESVFSDNENLMRYLLNELSLPVNSCNMTGMSPLHFAVFAKSNRMMTLLLNCGAFVDPRDNSGMTPLMIACQRSDISSLTLLIDRGASVCAFDKNGDSALHHAARSKHAPCVRALLRHPREDPNRVNFFEETPLHVACFTGGHTMTRFLLEGGGDPDLKNKAGKSCVDLVASDNARLRSLINSHTR